MSSLPELAQTLGQLLVRAVPPLLAATSALLLVALVGDWLLRNRVSASARLLLYLPVLARAALPLAWASPVGLLASPPAATVMVGGGGVPMGAASPGGSFLPWLGLAYVMVVAALLARWAQGRLSLARALRSARPLPGTVAMVHDRIGPVVAGVLHPRIVVPAAMAGDLKALALVLRHEAAHVARRDPLLAAAIQLACIVAWPLLPVWIAALRMRALMELASDERALAEADGHERRRYGELLLALADPDQPLRRPVGGLAFGSGLRSRLRALAPRRCWPAVAQVAVVAILSAIAVACSGAPTSAPRPDAPAKVENPDSPPVDGPATGTVLPPNVSTALLAIDPSDEAHRPRLSPALINTGKHLWTLMKVCVARDGLVQEVKVMRGADPAVDPAVVAAVASWRYRPYTVDGRAVPFCTVVRYELGPR
jgi:hypothetical protein